LRNSASFSSHRLATPPSPLSFIMLIIMPRKDVTGKFRVQRNHSLIH
jgi:hypothetical protein